MTSLELITADGAVESPEQWRELIADTLEQMDPGTDAWTNVGSALSMLLVDAVLSGDTSVLEAASDPLRDRLAFLLGEQRSVSEARGWLLASLATVRWALQRLPSHEEVAIGERTQARRFLELLLENRRLSSANLRKGIPTDHAQLSRLGKNLLASGLVLQRRAGREAIWELTPRGQQLMRHLRGRDDGPDHGAPADSRSVSSRRAARAPRPDGRSEPARLKGPVARDGAPRERAVAGARMLRDRTAVVVPDKDSAPVRTRYVVPGPRGWGIKTKPDGRTVETRRTKQEAVARAREIVANAGGGIVQPVGTGGEPSKPISVAGPRQ